MTTPKRPPTLLLIAAGAMIAIIGFGLWRYSRFNTVHVVNGLSVPVTVTLENATLEVKAAGRASFPDVPAGSHVVTAKANGVELETLMVFVRGGSKSLIYNVGGTAPLVWERIAYSTRNSNTEPQWSMFCGRRFIEHESPDYLFTAPPRSISTKGGGTLYKTHLDLDPGGLKACQSWALDKGTPQMWADWNKLEARVDPSKVPAAAAELARQGDFREAQLLIETALEKDPTLDLNRQYLRVLLASGQLEKATARFGRAVDDAQANDVDLYFAAMLLPQAERLKFLTAARVRFPSSGYVAWGLARTLDRAGRTAEALPLYKLQGAPWPEDIEWDVLYDQIGALMRLKKQALAWDLTTQAYRDSTNVEGAVMLANVAAATGNTIDWGAKLKPHQLRWANTLLGLPVTEPRQDAKSDYDPDAFRKARVIIRVTLGGEQPAPPVAKTKPKKGAPPPAPPVRQPPQVAALALARSASEGELRLVPSSIIWLLLTEAWRVGDASAAAKLQRHAASDESPRIASVLHFIATGESDLYIDNATESTLAVLWLARGRRLATLGLSPKVAYAEARRLDAFKSTPTRALDTWPEATPLEQRLAFVPVE